MSSNLIRNTGSMTILVVCNEPSTAAVWGYMIREQKLQAIIETSPENALNYCMDNEPTLVILDLHLSKTSCMELCRKMRIAVENPILAFLPSYDEKLIINYYATGIDDCVVKPISPVVFYSKVKAWLRHSKMQPVPAMEERNAGGIILRPDQSNLVKPDGSTIKLTELEVRLLHLLMGKPGHVFDSEFIVNKVWGLYGEQDLVLLKHAIYRLRRKLEDDPDHPRWIQTWHAKGYFFNLE
jgi:DNA-binding response OmpR family regulator